MSINPELIEAIAAERVVDASLVEKDWYAIRIIAVIAKDKHPTMRLVFSGGTSLAKRYGLIQRFSEDIDFKVQFNFLKEIKIKFQLLLV